MASSESEGGAAYGQSESVMFQAFDSEACSVTTSAAWGTSQAAPLHLGSERPGYKRSGSDRSGSEKPDPMAVSSAESMESSGGLEYVSEVAAFGGGVANV